MGSGRLEKIGKDFCWRKLFFYNLLKSAGEIIFLLKSAGVYVLSQKNEKNRKESCWRSLFFYNLLQSAGVYVFLKRMKRMEKNLAGASFL